MVRVTFEAPEDFAETPVGMTEEEVRKHVAARLRGGADGARAPSAETLSEVRAHSQRLRESGTLYCGSFLGAVDAEPSLATLTVNVVEFPCGDDPRLATEGMAQALSAARGPLWAGSLYELPCGQPACVLTGPVVHRSPEAGPDAAEVAYAKLQAFVPVPLSRASGEQLLLVVDFSSPSPGHWDRYMEIPARLLRSLSFAETETETSTETSTETEREGP
ncbi:hypothetical protein [Streptomyces profundus]|uniref:hypothetical protein n=1 Tax=Streptomyces profundus TaxID=2867410 RepID=UPI001D1629E3|nr:hypothetical protein [Streptomyces sp. MA3_2.13]UED84472.1 hypothetical protein K4G22_09860 [Streptomyces sp. MA3_2.13]